MSLSPKPSPCGFTLIELLATVAIVAVLSVLALTGLGTARKAGDRAACAANLHDAGAAILLFAGDHDGTLPGPVDGGQSPGWPTADSRQLVFWLAPYLGLTATNASSVRPTFGVSALTCPAYLRLSRTPSWVNRRTFFAAKAVATVDGTMKAPFGSYPSVAPIRLLSVAKLASGQALCDLDRKVSSGYANDPNTPALPVHGNVRNTLFLDGHVEPVPVP